MIRKLLNRFSQIEQSVLGMNERNIGLIYPNNARVNYKYADDKYLAKGILESNGLDCPETYGVIAKIGEIDSVWQQVSHREVLVIKPAKGAGGNGILILKKREGQWFSGSKVLSKGQIFTHLANIIFGIYSFGDDDRALIEEYVRPHAFCTEIYEAGVPDFRVILLNGVPVMAMLRVPTARSKGKANLHQGGLGIGIDMESGTLTHAYNGREHLQYHPDSGHCIYGKQVPFWQQLLDLSVQTAKAFPLDYLGVDLVIDATKGPMVMEVNVRPGLAIQLANKQGLAAILNNL